MLSVRKLIVPSTHLNGTGSKGLTEGYIEVIQQIERAMDALQKIAPHGRDYYVYEYNALGLATQQHEGRYKELAAVRDELKAVALGVYANKQFVEFTND